MTSFSTLVRLLADGGVECILVGGLAGIVHGASRATYDVDVVYRRTPTNIERLARALAPHAPYLRGAPPGLPFVLAPDTIVRGLNFTLTTTAGDVDLFGEIAGGGRYEDLVADTVVVEMFGGSMRCVSLDKLVDLKRAAGRPKDLEAIAELEALLEERDRPVP